MESLAAAVACRTGKIIKNGLRPFGKTRQFAITWRITLCI